MALSGEGTQHEVTELEKLKISIIVHDIQNMQTASTGETRTPITELQCIKKGRSIETMQVFERIRVWKQDTSKADRKNFVKFEITYMVLGLENTWVAVTLY